jgi:hypothetical protein
VERVWPLTGRSEELDFVLRLLGGEASGVVLAGEAGVGKTRLGRDIVSWAGDDGWTVEELVATPELQAVPLGVFHGMIPHSSGAEIADVLAQLGERGERILLFIDDAHHLDPSSLATVQLGLRRGTFFGLLTARTDEPGTAKLSHLWKDGVIERLDLQPLSFDEMSSLSAAVLGGAIERPTLARLWEVTQGNALYLHEVLRAAIDSGALVDSGGIWTGKPSAIGSGGRLTEVITARLDGLGASESEALEFVALAGPIGLTLLERLTAARSVEVLEADGLIRVAPSGKRVEVAVAHPLYAEVVRERMPVSRARRLKATLADAITELGARRRTDLISVARWRLDSGTADDPEILAAAAQQLMETHVVIGEHAIDDRTDLMVRLAGAAFEREPNVQVGFTYLMCLDVLGRFDEFDRVSNVMQGLVGTDEERMRLTWWRARHLVYRRGEHKRSDTIIATALQEMGDVSERLTLEAQWAAYKLFSGRTEEALDILDRLLGIDDFTTHPSYWLVLRTWADAVARGGRTSEALAAIDRVIDQGMSSRGSAEARGLGTSIAIKLVILILAGRLTEMEQLIDFSSIPRGAGPG